MGANCCLQVYFLLALRTEQTEFRAACCTGGGIFGQGRAALRTKGLATVRTDLTVFSYVAATSGAITSIGHQFHRYGWLVHCQADGNIPEMGRDAEPAIIVLVCGKRLSKIWGSLE